MSFEIFWYQNKKLFLLVGFIFLMYKRIVNAKCVGTLLLAYFVITFIADYDRRQRMKTDTPIIIRLKEEIRPLVSQDDFDRLVIHDMKDKFPSNKVAHTRSKAEIYMCTRKKGSKEDEEFEKLVFVLLHELSHFICSRCVQHDKPFKETFDEMLRKADKLGIRYTESPKICGVSVL